MYLSRCLIFKVQVPSSNAPKKRFRFSYASVWPLFANVVDTEKTFPFFFINLLTFPSVPTRFCWFSPASLLFAADF
jgi:hypothetical protein